MSNKSIINSDLYWNGRFSENWEINEGPSQSRFFSRIAIESLPYWLIKELKRESLTLVDWGCAQGDGTDVWATYIDAKQIAGVDFSSVAIEQATQRYPAIRFINEDWLEDGKSLPEKFDVVFSSNTLEHFHQPYDALRMLSGHAKKAIVLALPYREVERIDEHFFSFFPENIPLRLDNGFRLIWSRVMDCRKRPGTLWHGDQIILAYAEPEWFDSLSLTLDDCEINQFDTATQLAALTEATVTCNSRIKELTDQAANYENRLDHASHALQGRDEEVGKLHQALADSEQSIASLKANLVNAERQLTDLNRSVADRDAQIASLTSAAAETNGQIEQLSARLNEFTGLYNKVMNSKSMRITSFVRVMRHKADKGGQLAGMFARTMRAHGLRYAVTKAGRYLQQKGKFPGGAQSAPQAALTNQEHYQIERSAQNGYVGNCISAGIDQAQLDLIYEHFAHQSINWNKVVLFPLSYPLELTQRPDHLLRNFAENGYHCIIVSIDNQPPYIRKLSDGIYITNLFAATIGYFADKKVIFYITYPFYSYIVNHLHNAVVVYDVLDDLSVFSLNCDAMRADHANLLARSDIVLFSSYPLMQHNSPQVKGDSYLVTNGVWVKDFKLAPDEAGSIKIQKANGEFVVGYHGAISELLDWQMLEKIIEIPKLRLILIGPIVNFEDATAGSEAEAQKRVLASDKTTYIGTVQYADLKYYLAGFDAGIVPFRVNEKTDPVSPLKLFEYMAIGLKVFATPTKTLSGYSDFITVADRTALPARIEEAIRESSGAQKTIDYEEVLVKADWGKQMVPVLSKIDDIIEQKKPRDSASKTVDIVNVNFYDWDGAVLYKGGAERYVFDLACLLKEHGWSPRILQNANHAFEKEYRGIPVVGVETGCGHDLRGMSKKYREVCKDADLVIASPLDLACELWGLNVIGINHGIYWDHKYKALSNANINEYRNVFDALKAVSFSVCVDTNFINWVRTYDYGLGRKLRYVPNYFEGNEFSTSEKDFSGRIRVLYPRRLYEARGIFITLKAFEYLFKRYDNVDLHLVGQANADDGKIVGEFVAKYADRVVWEELDMHDMHKAYRTSHIALVPTMYSEGTSLSCLEAMATNNAVIATNIGGLPNLVIDGFNGLLIDPNAEALVRAIESLVMNREKMRVMASKGLDLAAVFEKQHWRKRWLNAVTEVNI